MKYNDTQRGGLSIRRPYMQIEQNGKLDYLAKFDYFLMGTVLLISLIGLVFLESAMRNMYQDGGKSAMMVQILGLVAGAVIAAALSFTDYYLFRLFSWPVLRCQRTADAVRFYSARSRSVRQPCLDRPFCNDVSALRADEACDGARDRPADRVY